MTDPLDELESLLTTAQIEASGKRKVVASRKDWDENYRASFRAPENWAILQQVEIVHVQGNVRTLIGLYDDLRHVKVPRCRKLVRCEERIVGLPFAIEEVSGPHWLPAEAWTLRQQPTSATRELVADLELEMGQLLQAQAAVCLAHLVGGGLQRFCLQADTVFTGLMPRTILTLPAGLDILEGLSTSCKASLWKELNGHT